MYRKKVICSVLNTIAVLLALFFICPTQLFAAAKYQKIYLVPDSSNQSIGSTFIMSVMYDVSDNNNTLSGVGIRIHYDSNRLTYIDCKNISPFNISDPLEKTEDPMYSDRDSNTDHILIIAFADTDQGAFPGQELPYKLVDIIFQVKTGITSGHTSINLNFTSVTSGYYGISENIAVNIAAENNSQVHFNVPLIPTMNSVMFYGDDFRINGEPANIGDEIGVFDPDGVLCGHTIIENSGLYVLTVYGDDASTVFDEGAVENDILTFKVWDLSENFEQTVSTDMFIPQEVFDIIPACENSLPQWTDNNDRWGLNIHIQNCQEIPLKQGWNLFSFSINKVYYDSESPPSIATFSNSTFVKVDSLRDVLVSIDGKYDLIRNGSVEYFFYGQSLCKNSLHCLAAGHGYWIKMNEAATLKLCGPRINPSDTLFLSEGWNLVGNWNKNAIYDSKIPPTIDLPDQVGLLKVNDLKDILQAVDGKYFFVLGFDANGSETFMDPNVPSFLNTLHYLGPGYGFWIYMTEPADLYYPSRPFDTKYQQIYLTPDDIDQPIESTFTTSVMYHTSDGNRDLSGVGIRIHYDSSKFSYINCTNIAPQSVSAPLEKSEDPMQSDTDPNTDRMIMTAWADSNQKGFPGQTLPFKLMDIKFQVKSGIMPGSTSINTDFTSVASDYSGESENAIIHITSMPGDSSDHFKYSVPSTGSLLSIASLMMIYGDDFTINNKISEIGDEIAVFDQQGMICGHYVVSHPGYFRLDVYEDDEFSPEDEGAVRNEDLIIKVWDASAGIEITLDESMIIKKDVFGKKAIMTLPLQFVQGHYGMGIAALRSIPAIEQIGDWYSYEDHPKNFSFQIVNTESVPPDLSTVVKHFCPDLMSSLNYVQNFQNSLQTFDIELKENQFGTCPIAITVTDAQLTVSESFMISVYAVNDRPLAKDLTFQTSENKTCQLFFEHADVDGDILTPIINKPPNHGVLSQDLIYTPDNWFRGTDSLVYSLSDGHNKSLTATVSITVNRAKAYTLMVECMKGQGEIVYNGYIVPLPWKKKCLPDEEISIIARSTEDRIFNQWILDETSFTDNPLTITMDHGKTIIAKFVPPARTVRIVGYQFARINGELYELPLEKTFFKGDQIHLQAEPQYLFKGWSGDIHSVQNPINVAIESNMIIGALFKDSREWAMQIQAETVDLPQSYTDQITIGVSLLSETKPYILPGISGCSLWVYSSDWERYDLSIHSFQPIMGSWVIGIDPFGNIGSPEARTSRLFWNPMQLSNTGYFRMYQGVGQTGSIVIPDMRTVTSYEVTGKGNTEFTIVWSDHYKSTVRIQTQPGWNLISLPVRPLDLTASIVFPNTTILAYENGAYVPVNQLQIGRGYWIKNNGWGFDITGEPIGEFNQTLNNGWHLIGGLSQSVEETFSPNCVEAVYGYNNGAFIEVSEFIQGKGYWIKLNFDRMRQ
jgi:hypothetical protein